MKRLYSIRKTQPYNQLHPNVPAILNSDKLAQAVIEGWIKENSTVYFRNSHNSFSNHKGILFVTVRNVVSWTGLRHSTIYRKLYSQAALFRDLGVWCVDDSDSPRLDVARAAGLDNYIQMTRSLYMFSPRAVVLFLLTSKTTKGESFRDYIEDWSPEDSYHLAKLSVTIKGKINAEV